MRVSLNTVKEYTSIDGTVEELVSKINGQLGGVEEVTDLGARYEGATIVKVVNCSKHPNADKLSVCEVDDGSGELTTVVCGAPNVQAGIFAVWLKPGMVVPSTAGDAEPFVLGARELRGVMSNGMLAAGDELAINNDHNGIIVITERDLAPGKTLFAGASFAQTFDLNDTLIDIENKMFTHRPDLFGQLGVAREIAGIQGKQFDEPEWYSNLPTFDSADKLHLSVFNDTPQKVPRLMAVVMDNVRIEASPLWLQTTLLRWGSKSINNVVDMTNYTMLLTAQPTHAYDYDKLRGQALGARMATNGETVTLLNGKTYELVDGDIVMADGEGAVGLAGVMGGKDSEVDESTTRIVLEVATFDMYTVRKTAMRHGIFTDALTRFNKGQSPLQNDRVLALLISNLGKLSGATQASSAMDNNHVQPEQMEQASLSGCMTIPTEFITARLGLQMSAQEITALLTNVNFSVSSDHNGLLKIVAPFWRTDSEVPEDIVEEVGRLYGFDKLPRELPLRPIKAAFKNPSRSIEDSVRRQLAMAGANEILSYSFVHEKLIEKSGQDKSHAYKLSNALSPDLQYYRLSLTPSLLDKIHPNIKAGFEEFALFEIGKVHYKDEMDKTEPTVPNEDSHVALVIAKRNAEPATGAAYYYARRFAAEIVDLSVYQLVPMKDYDFSKDERGSQLTAAYDSDRSSLIVKNDKIWGVIGEYRPEVRRAFKLPDFAAGFELRSNVLKIKSSSYRPLSKFPSISQDVSIRTVNVDYAVILGAIDDVIKKQASEMYITVTPSALYRPANGSETTATFRLSATSFAGTLTAASMRQVIDAIAASCEERFNGRMV